MSGDSNPVRLVAVLAGEMAADQIEVGAWANVDALTKGDDDPLPVVVRVPEGMSTRGWYYTAAVIEKIAGEINKSGLPGYEGHQRPEDVAHEFKPISTHWLGAKVVDEGGKKVMYARGLVDKSASNLKRWIRAKMIREVSIFGNATVDNSRVVDYKPLSLDWTPPGRSGMPTSVAWAGEMDSTIGSNGAGDPGPRQDPPGRTRMPTVRETCGELLSLNATPGQVIGEMRWPASEVVQALNRRDLVDSLSTEVVAAIPVGEIAKTHTLPSLLPAYSSAKLADIADLVDKEGWGRLQNIAKAVGEMAQVLKLESGKDSAGEVLEALKGLLGKSEEHAKAARSAMISKVVGEITIPTDLRPMVSETLERELTSDAKEEDAKKLVGEMKDRPTFKPLFTRAGPVINPQQDNRGTGDSGHSNGDAPAGLRRSTKKLV